MSARKQSKRARFAAFRRVVRHWRRREVKTYGEGNMRLVLRVEPTREQMVDIINAAEAAGDHDAVERLAARYAEMWG